MPSLADIRSRFPSLAESTVFLDNAGGSQLPGCVIDAAGAYLRESYVQLGADYEVSRRATSIVSSAHVFVETYLNARGPTHDLGRVVLASSTSVLCHILAWAYAESRVAHPKGQRNRIIVSTAGHESNIGPWMRLAARGFEVIPWKPARNGNGDWDLNLPGLRAMLDDQTLLVAFPHVSNILGDIWDAAEAVRLAKAAGARTLIDGVAYAPHRAPDVAALGCDWYFYSLYKVFGPHMAALYGSHEAFAELQGPNHYFIRNDDVPYKFELGGVNHEGAAMIVGAADYYRFLAERPAVAGTPPRDIFSHAFAVVERLETELQAHLIGNLLRINGLRLWGRTSTGPERVPTVSFTIQGMSSRDTALALNARGLGVRYGHFYSKRLIESIGLDPDDGVIRASPIHYNSHEEIDRLLDELRRVSR